MISPRLREAARQGYIRAKYSPIAAFVSFSLSRTQFWVTRQWNSNSLTAHSREGIIGKRWGWEGAHQLLRSFFWLPVAKATSGEEQSRAAFVSVTLIGEKAGTLRDRWGWDLVLCPSPGDALFKKGYGFHMHVRDKLPASGEAGHSRSLKLPLCSPVVCTAE